METITEIPAPRASNARGTEARAGHWRLAVAAVVAFAAVLRLWRLGHQSFWYDESFTVVLVHHSPAQILRLLPRTELTPPVYYLLAWAWAQVFGSGEAGLRLLSALAGIATVPVLYAAGAKLLSRRAGLVVAALAACNPLLVWYSQEARSYALLVLWASLSLLAFAHARTPRPRARWLVAWALAASLTLATHYYGVIAVAPEAVWLLWIHRRDFRVVAAVAAAAAVGAAFLPLALSQRPQASWIAAWPLDRRLGQIGPQLALGPGAPARTWLKLAAGLAVVLAGALLVTRAEPEERRAAMLAGGLSVAGFAIVMVLLLFGVDELITRNLLVALAPLLVALAGGLGARRAGMVGAAGAATLCLVGLVAVAAVATDPNLERPNWRGVVHAIGARPPAGGGRAVLLQNNVFLMPLAVYMPGLQFMKRAGTPVQELDVVAVKGPSIGWFCWWGSVCNLPTARLDTSLHVRGFHRAGPVLSVDRFRIMRLVADRVTRITPHAVFRALGSQRYVPYSLLVQSRR